ncbi:MAG: hypothetical protein Q6365_022510, partial [Candidatus Sigynarchaeota archaeon]
MPLKFLFQKKLDARKERDLVDTFDLEKEYPEFKGWESIGFHRPLGDEMWQYAIEIIQGALGILLLAFFISLLNPFPEIAGYAGIAGGVFSIIYQIFDIGTNYGISRWIAEYRIRDPQKMLEYLRFAIWYQMFTGLIQITILSFVTFQFLTTSEFAYVIWLLLIGLQKQWPGMLSIFKNVLGGLQHYDKTNIISFLQGEIVQRATNVVFVLLGRWYGETHPEMGMIMGMAIGASIGGYIDDIFIMFVSGYFFNKILKKAGITFKDAWQFKFGRDVIRNCLFYGAQTSVIPIINSFTGTLAFFWYVDMIPGLATWKALAGFAANFSGIIDSVGRFSLTAAIAESYSIGKKELAEF